ncbi:MAG: hypothetical protein A3K59_03580 [Euryarchaeota archaeon RBG_19FT_COMBO_69_17]|uniref:Hydrophobic amino acid ABC transporter permease n=2 Tax=environmental samples TaxID=68359 RepID=A0A0H4T285_9EURY|nr:hydrophobic amino acid ABC transporter permease [uncultured euryarchaeote Rifle_16ft_4_minimus_23719]AKQ02742.1 hydrophobic amino acid ABC transporter permease [uncultured euryarchaeote Rifle_16ft_4_minimus_37664]OGS62113.1 MAG: hypothetical protein A3K59_03580 [Euryarchaeota archaeon RBG_19FT_COMBO_69_17]
MRIGGRGRKASDGPPSQSSGALLRRIRDLAIPLLILAAVIAASAIAFGPASLRYALTGAVTASVVIPGAIGLSLLYGIRKFANFAHGELMSLGAYIALAVNVQLRMDLAWAFVLAALALAPVGVLLELAIFSRLGTRGPVPSLVASIGLSLVLQNLIAAVWGTEIQVYRIPVQSDIILPGGLPINPVKGILTISLGLALVVSVHLLLTRTFLGKAMRATADNMDLARSTGIRARRVILWTWVLTAALAAVGGILIGLARDIRPTMGFDLLLLVFAAVVLGGIGSPYGAMFGGLVIGLATEMSVPFLSWLEANAGLVHGTAYDRVVAFLIMVVVLLVRPEGILGGRRQAGGTGAIRWIRSRVGPLLGRRTGEEAHGD